MRFLDENAAGMTSEISRLKTEGLLDRRSASKIRIALNHARDSMIRIAEGTDADEPIDGWTARMISYDLGMAADTLALQANAMEKESGASPGDGGVQSDILSEGGQPGHLARTLRKGSSLLKGTARAIVRYLK